MRALAEAGEPEGSWLRADRQTGGKGRRGRVWISPEGNLHASTLVRLRKGDPPAPTLALVAAVALHDTVSAHLRHSRESGNPASSSRLRGFARIHLPFDRAKTQRREEKKEKRDSRVRGNDDGEESAPSLLIKWPNDLLLDGKKLAGILLERADDAVILGFGVNLAHAPEGLDRPATSLAAHALAPTPDDFLAILADAFVCRLISWRSARLAPVRAAWLAAAHSVGTALSTPEGEGLFDGLDENGALRLRLADNSIRVIQAGDVFLV